MCNHHDNQIWESYPPAIVKSEDMSSFVLLTVECQTFMPLCCVMCFRVQLCQYYCTAVTSWNLTSMYPVNCILLELESHLLLRVGSGLIYVICGFFWQKAGMLLF